jgi:hypothetical protein
MTTRLMLLSVGILGGLAVTATPVHSADLRPAVITGLTGTLHVVQPVPCDNVIDKTTPVNGGRFLLTPAEGLDAPGGGKRFTLTRADLSFAPFSASGSCLGIDETRSYDAIHVQLARAATFLAEPTSTPGLFTVNIPWQNFLLRYGTFVNGDVETATKHPMENVTGTLNLNTGAVQMHVVLGTRVTFKALCFGGCLINETHDGTLTADLTGTLMLPDTDGDGVPDGSDNCPFVVNRDQSPVSSPVIVAPDDITVASCSARTFGFNPGVDVCFGDVVTVVYSAPNPLQPGSNLVTWTATARGRIARDTQTVTVVDTTAPAFTSVPLNLSLNNCTAAKLGVPIAVDDCGSTTTIANNAPRIFQVGKTAVTWTATDAFGNRATVTQNVVVTDAVAPTATCAAVDLTGMSFRVSATDACAGAPVIRLGDYILAQGETIAITETEKPGVRLISVAGSRIRQFEVGKGEGVISATDVSGNAATAVCR